MAKRKMKISDLEEQAPEITKSLQALHKKLSGRKGEVDPASTLKGPLGDLYTACVMVEGLIHRLTRLDDLGGTVDEMPAAAADIIKF